MSDESPGAIIRRARQEARMKQRELADRMGVHVTTVGYWERGKFFPEQHWAALNKLLHISLVPPGAAESAASLEPDVLADEFGEENAARLRRVFGKRGETGAQVLQAIEDELRRPGGDAAQGGSGRSSAAG
jgi:transcriptional regulator with XRE-family HTH domain